MSESPKNFITPEKAKEYKYDVIVTLGGGIRKHEKRGWRTTNYSESDNYGALGSRVRIIATEYLAEKGNVAENFLTTTGKPNYLENEPDAPGESEIGKKELISRGIPEEKIFLENESKNTKQNIENVLKIALDHNWKKILILSSNYHIPRIKALYEKAIAENKDYEDITIDFQGAEDVLTAVDPRWQKYIDQANSLEEMKKREENEKKGVDILKSGKAYSSIQETKEPKK
jgi:uncharacterized SAM-binding protein YcdF (DUF218 family)